MAIADGVLSRCSVQTVFSKKTKPVSLPTHTPSSIFYKDWVTITSFCGIMELQKFFFPSPSIAGSNAGFYFLCLLTPHPPSM